MSATVFNTVNAAMKPLTTLHGTVQTIVKTKAGITSIIDLTGGAGTRVLNLPTDVELPIGENVKITVTSTEPF